MAHYNSYDLREIIYLPQDNCGNSRANILKNAVTHEAADLLVSKPTCFAKGGYLMTLDNFTDRTTLMLTTYLLKWLTYQLSMVRSKLTMVVTGNGESVFDSGEGA